jgi:hypothetical protein
MATHASPAYRDAAELAARCLHAGTLVGIHESNHRFLITLRQWQARPAHAPSGALFQCLARRSPPLSGNDLPGWIVLQNGFRGGRLIMVHELSHFANRFLVWRLGHAPGFSRNEAMVRSRWLDEVAARHLAYLAESAIDPEASHPAWPAPGALFACAVKIASYPEIYHDSGLVTTVRDQGRPALRDLVGSWFPSLTQFCFYQNGSLRAEKHKKWLENESALARLGRNAPDVPPEGTL